MNTDRLMQIALDMAGLNEIPGDSAIHVPGDDIERVLVGIDLGTAELYAAKSLGYDAVLTHHPVGAGVLGFYRVLYRHIGQMTSHGVPEEAARAAIEGTAQARRILDSMRNYDHEPSIARWLRMPYLNIHTPLDEIGRRRMAEVVASVGQAASLGQLVERLSASFGEFGNAETKIEIAVGDVERPVGRAVVSHAAGTNGGYAVAKAYFDHGIDTVLYIHCRPDDVARLREEFGPAKALVVTGHIASDSIGINPYVDRLRAEGLDVTALSGVLPGERRAP